MNKLLVVIFDSEEQAQRGTSALTDLHAEGALCVHAAAVINKAADGSVSLNDTAWENPLSGMTISPLAAGVLGLVGASLGAMAGVGPLAAVAGALTGVTGAGFTSLILEFLKAGDREEFATEVASYLLPGKYALVADMVEDRPTATDRKMRKAGRLVFRQPRSEAMYFRMQQEMLESAQAIWQLREKLSTATPRELSALQARLRRASRELQARMEAVSALEDANRKVAAFKQNSLQRQIEGAPGLWQEALRERSREVLSRSMAQVCSLRTARSEASLALTG